MVPEFGWWGRNKGFWPEYLPMMFHKQQKFVGIKIYHFACFGFILED